MRHLEGTVNPQRTLALCEDLRISFQFVQLKKRISSNRFWERSFSAQDSREQLINTVLYTKLMVWLKLRQLHVIHKMFRWDSIGGGLSAYSLGLPARPLFPPARWYGEHSRRGQDDSYVMMPLCDAIMPGVQPFVEWEADLWQRICQLQVSLTWYLPLPLLLGIPLKGVLKNKGNPPSTWRVVSLVTFVAHKKELIHMLMLTVNFLFCKVNSLLNTVASFGTYKLFVCLWEEI